MPLIDTINADLKAAMLARDEFTTTTLRGIKAAILNEEVARGARETGLEDGAIEQLIAREVKKRDEAASLFEQGGNQASADKERAEKEILMKYLPQRLSEAEIQDVVTQTINEMGASGMQAMGLVIKAVKDKLGNTADGAVIARLVKASLQ